MNTRQGPSTNLPIKGKLVSMYVSSSLIAVLMTVVSLVGLRDRTLFYPTDELVQTFVPNDVVNLLIGLPTLLVSMWLAWRGRLVGLLCWTGALFFVFYNYLAYVFAVPLYWALLVYLMLVALSGYTLLGLIAKIDGKVAQLKLRGAVPEKFAGGVLAGLGSLFLLRVIAIVVQATTRGSSISQTELAVSMSDFLITPAWIIVGILLWRRKELGYVAGLGMLFQGSMLFIALIIFFLLRPFLTNVPFAVADLAVVFIMGLVCFIPFTLFARGVTGQERQEGSKYGSITEN